jgi:RimJ/RimL family protein N-acetyltransferase
MAQDEITLRDVEVADFEVIMKWFNNPPLKEAVRAENFWPTLSDLQHTYWPIWQARDPKTHVLLIVLLNGEPIGEVGYRIPDPPGHTAEVDIKIGETSVWGRGYGTTAMQLLIDRLFANSRLDRIISRPGDWNLRSIALFKRLGFREISREPAPPSIIFEGGTAVVMALNRSDFSRRDMTP